MMIIIYLEAI